MEASLWPGRVFVPRFHVAALGEQRKNFQYRLLSVLDAVADAPPTAIHARDARVEQSGRRFWVGVGGPQEEGSAAVEDSKDDRIHAPKCYAVTEPDEVICGRGSSVLVYQPASDDSRDISSLPEATCCFRSCSFVFRCLFSLLQFQLSNATNFRSAFTPNYLCLGIESCFLKRPSIHDKRKLCVLPVKFKEFAPRRVESAHVPFWERLLPRPASSI